MNYPADISTPAASHAHGAVMGALIGDAAGAVLEFMGREPTATEVEHALTMPGGGVFGVAPGQVTDDGELTMALLNALAAKDGVYRVQEVTRHYVAWAESNPFDIGNATQSALRPRNQPSKGPVSVMAAALSKNSESKANGALMRITPLGVAAARMSPEQAVKVAALDASLTHPNPSCQHANAAYVLAIRHLILNAGDRSGAVEAAHRHLASVGGEVLSWLEDALAGRLAPGHPNAGFVKIGFVHAFHHLHRNSGLVQALTETLLIGGDTDTNACIVGGLVGAACGIASIQSHNVPFRPLDAVLNCTTHEGQPRPGQYHPSGVPGLLAKVLRRSMV